MKNHFVKLNILAFCLLQANLFLFAQGTPAIKSNKYLDESTRLMNLAKKEFAGGNYEYAVKLAEDAAAAAKLSDNYSKDVVKMSSAKLKLQEAAGLIGKADSEGTQKNHPNEFWKAKEYYNIAFNAGQSRKWDDVIRNSNMVINMLTSGTFAKKSLRDVIAHSPKKISPLPAQYTVRTWEISEDCFWNIAERSWVYGNGRRWPLLYNANKNKLIDPKNPNLIEPGTIINIPSISGEKREGMWDADKKYSTVKK
ncbi:hypothetical protein FACS1894190_00270 [Spirochaetia bacterium]|nr:hypothetical protein FACS1894190_00270 [Spirochaetia bacterium]